MVTIYLKAIKNAAGTGYDLLMRDINGQVYANFHKIEFKSGSKVVWDLEDPSGIQDILQIRVKGSIPQGKVFKTEPKKDSSSKKFKVYVVKTDKDIEEEYNISFKAVNGDTVTIDPYIRVVPPPPNP
jgi:hypothetical protein